MICLADARNLSDQIKSSGGTLEGVPDNLIDIVWGKDRPARPNEEVKVHPIELAGKPVEEKIEELRKELEKKKKSGIIISMKYSPST